MLTAPIKVTLPLRREDTKGTLMVRLQNNRPEVLFGHDQGIDLLSVSLNLLDSLNLRAPEGAVFLKADTTTERALAEALADVTGGSLGQRIVTYEVPFAPEDVRSLMEVYIGDGVEPAPDDAVYTWTEWESESEMTGDGSGDPEKYFLTINDPFGEELAVIVHRVAGGEFPLDGPVAARKVRNAKEIVAALNATLV